MQDHSDIFYQFGPFFLDPVDHQLFRGDTLIPLTPNVFKTLLFLVSNSGRLLRKEEIMNRVWPESFVSESNLNQNIFVIRKALGETPDEKYVLTIRSQGFRFIARVKELKDRGTYLPQFEYAVPTKSSTSIKSLAILPFKYLGTLFRDEYLGYGIADALTTRLSGLWGIIVRPTTAVLKYNALGQDPVEAGQDLNVAAVIDGTIQLIDDRIRVSAQLIRVADGATIWADKFDEKFTNIFAIQDLISEEVAQKLPLQMSALEQRRFFKRRTENTEAYKLYLKGRYFLEKRTEAGLKISLEYFKKALVRDPGYALAHSGIADSYILLGEYLFLSPEDVLPKAKAAALKALTIDDTLAEAYASLAETLLYYDWSRPKAERAFQRALQLNPNYPTAHHWYAWFLMSEERFDEALAVIKRAQELDPMSLTLNTFLGLPFYYRGLYDQAIEQFNESLEMDPNFILARYYKCASLIHIGMYEEGLAEYERAAFTEYFPQTVAIMGFAYAMSGQKEEAKKQLNKLHRFSVKRYVPSYCIATIYSGLGDKNKAFHWLEKALGERFPWLIWLKIDPFMKGLNDDPRFRDLWRKIDAPE